MSIEISASSKTKKDEMLELLETIHYMPTMGQYKVLLIDEVHQLSNHAKTALKHTP